MRLGRALQWVGTDATSVLIPAPAAAKAMRAYHGDGAPGLPPHLTLAYPLPATAAKPPATEALRDLLAGVPGFSVVLDHLGRFGHTAYLAPNDPEPVAALARAIGELFPRFPLYGGAFDHYIPHVTLGDSLRPGAEDAVRAMLPIEVRVSVQVWSHTRSRWRLTTALELADPPA